ncbi:hypothetical protein CC1G_07236 [Coprinopsis cinerea okayama7|uniref:Uncharacterized protein n=1 Tax=Coprinopsis cinerea (strain Okayama-7 / 130 / ATCC MYA-4618 / FGSC 9003) TaxID=240176 RepID=A8PD15_COPC7|nr:hypothetical protein CC1G_07236 [Coprinopsis cinerea okayama7\|eukprot:XP_001840506.1 hypothetical protein CC1G_07236 [Coprinopsis cinerea okayama7\
MALATLRFIEKYPELYNEAFPLSIDLGPPDVPPQLPVKPPSIPAGVQKPFYGAGFFINNWYLRGHLQKIGCHEAIVLPSHVGRDWRRRQCPEPFIVPSILPCVPRDAFIYFVDEDSPPREVQKFLAHRDRILDIFSDIMQFTPQEAAFVRKNVRWYRHSYRDETLPPDICLDQASFEGGDFMLVG